MSFLDKVKDKVEQSKAAQNEAKARRESLIISTGDVTEKYRIIDAISAYAGEKEVKNIEKVFNTAKEALKNKALQMDGDAVIFCQFQPQFDRGRLDIFVYGTLIKFITD